MSKASDVDSFMFWVYVLYSSDYDKIYIDFTSDLENRILDVNQAIAGMSVLYFSFPFVYPQKTIDRTKVNK